MKQLNEIQQGLYRESFEHDNCGIGAIVNIKGRRSHGTVAGALEIVEHLEHRAGKDAEGKTGDGVGILLQISHRFFRKVCKPLSIEIGGERDYGVGMFFFPQDELKRNQAKNIFEVIVKKEGLNFLGWREVPVHPEVLGKMASDCMPCIMQAFIERPDRVEKGLPFDRRLYVVRRVFEQSSDDTYVVSLSSRTIVYKGMFLVGQLRQFLRIFRMRITSLLSPWFIPVLAPILRQAGKERIRTGLWCITERLTRSGEMQIRCGRGKRPWKRDA